MTGILDKFHVEHGIHGAKVMTRTHQLTSDCISNGEINSAIQMLKDDLDACAREMKRLWKSIDAVRCSKAGRRPTTIP